MIYVNTTRRILSILLLMSFSLAGFGPALHELAHLGDESSVVCSCGSCPQVDDSEEGAGQDRVQEDHDCAICRFLALAKQSDTADSPEVSISRLEMPTFQTYEFSIAVVFSLTTAPRGPPALSC